MFNSFAERMGHHIKWKRVWAGEPSPCAAAATGSRINWLNTPLLSRDRSAQPISIGKSRSRKKSPWTFAHLENFSKMCPPCLIFLQSCYFDYKWTNISSALRSGALSRNLDVVRAQRIMSFLLNYPQINTVGKSDHMMIQCWRRKRNTASIIRMCTDF